MLTAHNVYVKFDDRHGYIGKNVVNTPIGFATAHGFRLFARGLRMYYLQLTGDHFIKIDDRKRANEENKKGKVKKEEQCPHFKGRDSFKTEVASSATYRENQVGETFIP